MNVSPCRRRAAWACSILIFAAIGCGDDGLGKRYAVSGRVTYKGEPVKKANISFLPTQPEGRGAAGQVTDGSYSLTTLSPGDGAMTGTYTVTIDDRVMDAQKAQADADALAKKRGVTYTNIPQELIGKAARVAKGTLPGKYQIPETSGLKGEVKAQSNTINFELTD